MATAHAAGGHAPGRARPDGPWPDRASLPLDLIEPLPASPAAVDDVSSVRWKVAAAAELIARSSSRRSNARQNVPEMRQRVVQDGILALEVLDQLFLTVDRFSEPVDHFSGRLIDGARRPQPVDPLVQRVDLVDQRIVVPQQAPCARRESPIQAILGDREAVELAEHAVERHFSFRVDRAHREPGEQQQQAERNRRQRCGPHGAPPVTGLPR